MTLSLLAAVSGMYWLTPDKTLLYFNAVDIANGEAWRLVTGHFIHADPKHLFWNGLGLAVLGALVERRSATLLWATLGAGLVSVNVLLLSPVSQLNYYCGLSGVLNSLLLVALWLEWQDSKSWLLIIITLGCVMKVAVEISLGVSLMTDISWPPYAWSHAAGLLGGLALIWGQWLLFRRDRSF